MSIVRYILVAFTGLLFSFSANAGLILYTGGHSLNLTHLSNAGLTSTTVGTSTGLETALAGGGFDALLIGEGASFGASTITAITTYASGGGSVVFTGDHGGAASLINSVFGTSLSNDGTTTGGTSTLTAAAAGTAFASAPTTIANANLTDFINPTTLPSNATLLYTRDNPSGATTAFFMPFNLGSVTYLGWDFCCGTGQEDWYGLLASAPSISSIPEPNVLALLAFGLVGIGFAGRAKV